MQQLDDEYAGVRGKTHGRFADEYEEFIEKAEQDIKFCISAYQNERLYLGNNPKNKIERFVQKIKY